MENQYIQPPTSSPLPAHDAQINCKSPVGNTIGRTVNDMINYDDDNDYYEYNCADYQTKATKKAEDYSRNDLEDIDGTISPSAIITSSELSSKEAEIMEDSIHQSIVADDTLTSTCNDNGNMEFCSVESAQLQDLDEFSQSRHISSRSDDDPEKSNNSISSSIFATTGHLISLISHRLANIMSQPSLMDGPIIPSQHNKNYYKHLLEVASTYDQWHAAAHQLYRLEGNESWKDDPASPHYDYNLLLNRISQLRKARESGDIGAMIFLLRTSLSRNIGDMGNPVLYSKTRVGTKKLIEDYIDEVNRQLNLICESPDIPSPDNASGLVSTLDSKLEFFLNTRQSFGRTALLLSGGATLGLNHIGVIKALYECKLLPRIISGSSVGSMVAALICSKTDSELFDYLHDENLNFNALEHPDEEGSLFFKISRFVKHGVVFDVEVLIDCVRANIGDVTFQDSYNRTRRILNITVSSSTKYEMPRLLNYLTAPDVLIWSAVAASCAIPFVYRSAPLMARDKHGNIVPWNPSGHRWIDGSVENDLPMARLSELFNVNHFIVCQVNPHVVPFLSKTTSEKSHPFLSSIAFLFKSELQHRLSQLIDLEIFPTTLHRLQNVLSQRYSGDITIVPDVKLRDYMQIISNPRKETLWDAVIRGERATWPQMSIIRNHCGIELALDDIIYRLRCRKLDMAFSKLQIKTLPNGVESAGSPINRYSTINPGALTPNFLPFEVTKDTSPPMQFSLTRSRSVGRGMNHLHRLNDANNDGISGIIGSMDAIHPSSIMNTGKASKDRTMIINKDDSHVGLASNLKTSNDFIRQMVSISSEIGKASSGSQYEFSPGSEVMTAPTPPLAPDNTNTTITMEPIQIPQTVSPVPTKLSAVVSSAAAVAGASASLRQLNSLQMTAMSSTPTPTTPQTPPVGLMDYFNYKAPSSK